MKDTGKSYLGRVAFGLVIFGLVSSYVWWKDTKARRQVEEFCTEFGYVGSQVVGDSMAYCIGANGSRIDIDEVLRMSVDSVTGHLR